jgi:hypothetical protein
MLERLRSQVARVEALNPRSGHELEALFGSVISLRRAA